MSTDPFERFAVTLRGPRVVYGAGAARTELEDELTALAVRHVLVVASEREYGARRDLLAPLGDWVVGHFADVRRHVPRTVADAATALYYEAGADCLLSIGGGSATGTAKAVALSTCAPIVALPTTYAGSELTSVYGLTDERGKHTGSSDRVLPRTVLLDPELSADLPLAIARPSAVNALAHCVSGTFSARRSPVTDTLALEGVRLLTAGLRALAADPGDGAARATLTRGGYLAGTVLAHAGGSAHHTICHVLGGRFDLPHAETHTAVLPASCRFLQERDPRPAQRLAAALGAADLATGIGELLHETGAAVRLRDAGLAAADLPRAAGLLAEGVDGLDADRAAQLLAEAW